MERLSSSIKSSTDSWAGQLRQTSPLVLAAQRAELGPRALAIYLESLRFVFLSSHQSILAAAQRAAALSLAELARYFQDKAQEEHGHDQWARRDLEQLPRASVLDIEPAPACRGLVALQRELIAEHPICFLAYTVWAEYLTVLLGPEWLTMLASCGYDRSALTAVANHVDADVGHALAGFDALDRYWQGVPSAARIVDGVLRAQRGFEAFCNEVSQHAQTCSPSLGR